MVAHNNSAHLCKKHLNSYFCCVWVNYKIIVKLICADAIRNGVNSGIGVKVVAHLCVFYPPLLCFSCSFVNFSSCGLSLVDRLFFRDEHL